MELPDDLPLVRRTAVRLVVLDRTDHVLMFHTLSPEYPELGRWWELPGGGLDPGETHVAAAVRELFEETGFRITPADVGPPTWTRCAAYKCQGQRRIQDEVVMAVRLDADTPELDTAGQLDYELAMYTSAKWWPLDELLATTDRCYPGRLSELLPIFLAGETIDEPFEVWS